MQPVNSRAFSRPRVTTNKPMMPSGIAKMHTCINLTDDCSNTGTKKTSAARDVHAWHHSSLSRLASRVTHFRTTATVSATRPPYAICGKAAPAVNRCSRSECNRLEMLPAKEQTERRCLPQRVWTGLGTWFAVLPAAERACSAISTCPMVLAASAARSSLNVPPPRRPRFSASCSRCDVCSGQSACAVAHIRSACAQC